MHQTTRKSYRSSLQRTGSGQSGFDRQALIRAATVSTAADTEDTDQYSSIRSLKVDCFEVLFQDADGVCTGMQATATPVLNKGLKLASFN
jgi:hypothetical protein